MNKQNGQEFLYRFVLFVSLFNCIWGDDSVFVTTGQGKLRGLKLKSRNGTEYRAFLRIPYAKPPLGDLRFQPPQPPDSWIGVREATEQPPWCIQKDFFATNLENEEIFGQEDCLYINIYTPLKTKIRSTLPVMVSIHGGGFETESAVMFDAEYFLDHQIVLVTFNYRLGPLGFLSAADEILPGNYGMKDQVAALKWIKQHIVHFGGDPQQVTIFGCSAGAASAHFHMHSPLSKGLFHYAISQSGTALSSYTQISPSLARQRFHAVAILTGCPLGSTQMLVKCLRKVPAKDFVHIIDKFFVWDIIPMVPFPIVVEPPSVGDAFLTENPWKQNALYEVPWIIGITSSEGALMSARYFADEGKLAEELNINYKRFLPMIFSYQYWLKPDDVDRSTNILKQHYFGDEKIGLETALKLNDMIGDGFCVSDCLEASRRHKNKLYVYYYDHKGPNTFGEVPGNKLLDLGVSHGDELFNFFSPKSLTGELTSPNQEVSERMVNYWVNFARTGNPTSDQSWRPSTSEGLDYLHIKTNGDTMEKDLLVERYTFWKNLSVHPSHIVVNEKIVRGEL